MDKQARVLRFSRLIIKISGINKQMILSIQTNGLNCKSSSNYKIQTVLKAWQDKCIKGFENCIFIAKSLITFTNKISFIGKI